MVTPWEDKGEQCLIKTFKNKDLKDLFELGTSSKIQKAQHTRINNRLSALDSATSLKDLDLPGFKTHPLQGFNPTRYAISVNGAWRITFEYSGGDAYNVDLEQYH